LSALAEEVQVASRCEEEAGNAIGVTPGREKQEEGANKQPGGERIAPTTTEAKESSASC